MKKFITWIFILFTGCGTLTAQTFTAAQQMIYHQKYASAVSVLQGLLRNDPSNAQAWFTLAQAYIGSDHLEKPRDSLQLAPQQVKELPLFKSILGYILLKQGDSVAAQHDFDIALQDTKMKDPAVLAMVATAHINAKQGNAGYAVMLLQKAIKKDNDNPALYVLLGDAYRKSMDGGAAFNAYKQALFKDGKYAAAEYKLGKIFTSQNNPAEYLPYFEKAAQDDPLYAPALYELYYHYYFKDINLAKNYLDQYIAASDYDIKNDYLVADLLYTSAKYTEAINKSKEIINKEGLNAQARLYKLIGYSCKELGDSLQAAAFMNVYFSRQPDSLVIVKDFESMGDIYSVLPGQADSAAYFYANAADREKENTIKTGYYKKIAGIYKKKKDYNNEALWLGKYCTANPLSSNVDLFNWGLASYLGRNYSAADTIFGLYETKYPLEEYGYYWRAKANAAIDTAMLTGAAIPHYNSVIQLLEADTSKAINKKHLVEAYGYIAAYKANTEKDYPAAISYFDKLLALDPENADAKRYADILKKIQSKNAVANTGK